MRKIAGAIGLAAAATTSCLVVTSGVASASPAQPQSLYAPSALVLTVGQGEDAASTAVQRAVTLNCRPSFSGTHPAPREACAELAAIDGQFDQLTLAEPQGAFCTKEYRPIVVTAQGVWDGSRVSYEHTFPNSCVMRNSLQKSLVFEF
ncbi:subtilase-type protease inhibitor [Streptomyces sp. LX-29]|uniref:subtilase-type protease inhibitor n=1 Tax=Streptomyces sp. LX-29 TaxID=2900152 RepID=UPI00240D942B|nr:subtilase-type protease inhibitor [Streptomyces sp. LX-29]WFB10286.1 subtilase-type protease inhibitor [Streptomyces sp. LX-29]